MGKIVAFFVERNPGKLPPQILLKIPQLNPDIFKARSFTSEISGNSIVTLLKIDRDLGQVIIGDGSSSNLYVFDMGGHQLDQIPLSSPVTDVNVHQGIYDLTLTGILHPNNLNRESITRISGLTDSGAPVFTMLIDSLYRPVRCLVGDFTGDGNMDYLVCEYGNDIGRLAFYRGSENVNYQRKIIEPIPGSIALDVHDFNLDGDLDLIVAANFADHKNNPERGIMYFECTGPYEYEPYSIEASRENQWNTMDIGDIDRDGDDDVIIGAMYLQNVLKIQKVESSHDLEQKKSSLILLENQLYP